MFTALRVWIGVAALALVALVLTSGTSEVPAQQFRVMNFRGLSATGSVASQVPRFITAPVPPGLQNITGMPGNGINTGNAFTLPTGGGAFVNGGNGGFGGNGGNGGFGGGGKGFNGGFGQ
jgi:hypothetical protein